MQCNVSAVYSLSLSVFSSTSVFRDVTDIWYYYYYYYSQIWKTKMFAAERHLR